MCVCVYVYVFTSVSDENHFDAVLTGRSWVGHRSVRGRRSGCRPPGWLEAKTTGRIMHAFVYNCGMGEEGSRHRRGRLRVERYLPQGDPVLKRGRPAMRRQRASVAPLQLSAVDMRNGVGCCVLGFTRRCTSELPPKFIIQQVLLAAELKRCQPTHIRLTRLVNFISAIV